MGSLIDFFASVSYVTESNDSVMGTCGGLVGTSVMYYGGAYVSMLSEAASAVNAVAPAGTGTMQPGVRTLNSASDAVGEFSSISGDSGELVAGVTVLAPALGTTSASTGESTSEESSGDNIVEGILVIFQRDAMPYSHVEKKAKNIYSLFCKSKKKTEQFPTIIAHNQETYDAFAPIYGKSVKSLKENLEIMEAALRNESRS